MSFFKSDTWFDVFKHLALIGVLGAGLVLGFFYVYL
ncbi:MAG: penicillin-binding protein, partial [Cytophagaceae bacterium]